LHGHYSKQGPTIGHAQRYKKRYKMNSAQNPYTFGAWVKTRRRKLDLTQAELGKRAGCSAAAIRKLEADERKPSRQLAETLARALEISNSDQETFLMMARGVLTDNLPTASSETRPSIPNNLPALLTSTIDRSHDLTAVSSLIRENSIHLVTLLGPPGIGKTRLSIQTGTELLPDFPEGVWFVDLAEMEQAAFFTATVSRSLGFLELPPSPEITQLIAGLRQRQILLILDNFEHIVDQAAVDVVRILKNCPELRILVTSRVPLHIYGEHEYPLPALTIPPRGWEKDPDSLLGFEAVQLLVARTRQHQPKFSITPENAKAVVEICNVLEGIPLALELAAASLRRMTISEMVSLLNGFNGMNWVQQIGTSARDLPQRQRTLENVVAWSYSLLVSPQQDLFRKLGVFAGWFDDDAVAAICFDDPKPTLTEVHELLDGLCDQSLLVRDFQNGIPCWRMLELIHEYADLKLDSGGRDSLKPRFTQHFLNKLEAVNQITEHKQQDAFYHLNVRNLHTALKWAIAEKNSELGFLLAQHMSDLWMSHGYSKEGLELLKQLFALPDPSPPEVRIDRLEDAADLAWQKHDFGAGLAFSKETAELARINGLESQYLWFLNRLGRIYIEQGLYQEARQALEECYTQAKAKPGLINPGTPLAQLGELALFEGRIEEAKTALKQAILLLTETDDIFLAMVKVDLAEIAMAEKQYAQAFDWLLQSYEIAAANLRRSLAFLFSVAGLLVLSPGSKKRDLVAAAQIYGAIDTLSERSAVIMGSFYQENKSSRIALARKRLTAQEWLKAHQAGQSLIREEAFELAKKELKPS
jgi:predicted ATPase/transcriptional regulator with XRE-family HTH domain